MLYTPGHPVAVSPSPRFIPASGTTRCHGYPLPRQLPSGRVLQCIENDTEMVEEIENVTMDVYTYIYIYVSCNYIIYHLNKMCMTYEFVLLKNDVAK